MTDETKKLCLWASALYENERLTRDEIYFYITNSKSRIKEVSQTKQLVGYMLYNHFNYTMQMIAEEFSLINHSTVVYWMDRVQMSVKTNKRMKYRYDYLLDCIKGDVKEVRRIGNTTISKRILSDADRDFIRLNINRGYSVTYFADVLRKTRGCIKDYLLLIERKSNKFESKAMDRVRIHSYNKRQTTIDY